MATISLYKNKINGVGGLIDSIVKSSTKLDTQLGTLRNTLQGVDSSTCNLQDVVSSISSSSKSEQEKVADLKRLNSKLTDFITMTSRRDAAVKTAVERSKTDFYSKYSYLKPECEKNAFEHICDGLQSAGEWCKEHWKLIVTVVIVAVAVVLLCTGVGSGLGAVLLAGACWGAIMGACIGGVAGGISSAVNGGSFLDGFENGAFNGAISGAISGAITGGLTSILGPATTLVGSIGQGAAVGAASSSISSMSVTTINYLIDHGNLNGALDDVLIAGFSGAISGAIVGGITGGIKFKTEVHAKSWSDAAKYKKLTEPETRQILSERGLNDAAIQDTIDSFDGPIYSRQGNAGEIYTITETTYGDASGVYVTKGSAGATPADRINNLALPPNNTASVEREVILTRSQILLEGKVAPQPDWADIAGDNIPRTGGGWQVITDGGKYTGAIK